MSASVLQPLWFWRCLPIMKLIWCCLCLIWCHLFLLTGYVKFVLLLSTCTFPNCVKFIYSNTLDAVLDDLWVTLLVIIPVQGQYTNSRPVYPCGVLPDTTVLLCSFKLQHRWSWGAMRAEMGPGGCIVLHSYDRSSSVCFFCFAQLEIEWTGKVII